MHPTVEEQLRGIARLLAIVALDDALSPASAEALADATRMLRRMQATWRRVPAFLAHDNQATAAVLGEIAPLLPAEMAASVAAAVAAHPGESPLGDLDVVAVDERNQVLRALLAQAIAALPRDDAGTRARAAIAAHLRQRVERDPTLGRVPGE